MHGLSPSHQHSFIFSNVLFNFQKRQTLYSYKSTLSPCMLLCLCLWFRALGQPAPALLAGGLAWGGELGSPRWGKVSLCSAMAFHCQPLGDSCDSASHDRLLAQQWTLCALPLLLQPQLPPTYTLLTIFHLLEEAKSKISKHHSSLLGTGLLQLGKPGTSYRLFFLYSSITAMYLQSCFGMDKSS